MNNYHWNKKNVDLYPDEIAPWKLPRDKHATISVLKHRMSELGTVDEYLARCEQYFKIEYLRRMNGPTEQAWHTLMIGLNAKFNKRERSVVLECLQFGGNKEFWDGFADEDAIKEYFQKCYAFAINKIGFLHTHENIICAVIITELNRRNLFVYYLPVTPKWRTKIMSTNRNKCGTLLQQTDENGIPLYRKRSNIDNPLLCRTEFWEQRGGLTSFSDLQEDFFKKISGQYGAVRGKSTSLVKNTNLEQRLRFGRYEDDKYDILPDFDDMPFD
ncbi:MAG: plasmid recombination protein [Clostridia bacterium]|nr:plasmid recombination protein [Clostridia bacterium]